MKKRLLKKEYINIGLLLSFFLIVLFIIVKAILTRGELTPPHINIYEDSQSGIYDNVVRLDDKVADYYYYKGLNYTESTSTELPSGDNRGIYPNNRLVEANITYKGQDLANGLNAFVSLTDRQDTYLYNKTYPVNNNGTAADLSDDYILIELIENPFTDRPTDRGFNGWYTTRNDISFSYDNNYYTRYAKIPVTYSNGNPSLVTAQFNASWVRGAVTNLNNSWTTAFNNIYDKGMRQIDVHRTYNLPYDMTGYYLETIVYRWQSCSGLYNSYGVYQTNCTCYSGRCTYYELLDGQGFDNSNVYYEYTNGSMSRINNSTIPLGPLVSEFVNEFNETYNMAGYFKLTNVSQGNSIDGFYDGSGNMQTGTCSSWGGCSLYELIPYNDSAGNPSIIDQNGTYYYFVTRDNNIIVANSNTTGTWSGSRPFTLTSVHNGTNYNSLWTPGRAVRAYNDTNIENIQIRGNASRNVNTPSANQTTNGTFYGAWNNVRIGRGITTYGTTTNFTSVIGGYNNSTGSSSNVTKYRLIIESGRYSSFAIVNGGTSSTYYDYVESRAIYGNDYDRSTKNNSNLEMYYCASGSWGGRVYASSQSAKIFDLTVKSGDFGTSQYDYTTGIYVGGRSYGNHYALRAVKVEGGNIYNLLGGPLSDSSMTDLNDTHMAVLGGTINVIIGGAGTSPTYGNRIIQVTGGTISYSIFGGSNGYQGAASDGTVNGSSLIYVGGTAEIGTATNVANGSSIYGAEAGSVFGIGNGRTGQSSIGSSSNSNIIVKDRATVNNNIYGGGNFGATGISSGKPTTTTNIIIDGGVIRGSVFGGGNNNGSGNASVKSTINITMTSGEIQGSLYGGSNALGTVFGDVNMSVLGGTFLDSIYGGGLGGYTSSSSAGTYIRDKITMQIGSAETTPIVTNNIYGGSAYGSVNTANESQTYSTNGITMTIDNLQITGSVFGGSKGSATYYPKVNGDILINVNGGSIPSLFGGNDMSGVHMGTSTINLRGGVVNNVYGGGNQVSGNSSFINLEGATTDNIYGGSNQSGTMASSTITLKSGTNTNVYGGNNVGGKTLNANVYVEGGTLTNVYGGGKLADTEKTTVEVRSGTVPNVYGGGESASIDQSSNVTLTGGTVTNLFGGSNQSGTVPIANITINGGTATTVYGGNNAGGKTQSSIINANLGNVTTIYGGGKLADTGTSTINLKGTTVQDVYGGGEQASIDTSSNVNVTAGTITRVFGGSNVNGTVPVSNISVTGGTINTIYGGNNMGGTTTTTNINVASAEVGQIFGGGNQANTSQSNITVTSNLGQIEYIYGGGNVASVTTSTLNLNGGNIKYVYGGSNQSGEVTTSNVNVASPAIIVDLFGGNNAGGITNTSNITTTGGTINNIYGGGNQALTGTTVLKITGTTVNEEIYGGGKDGALSQNASTTITNSNITKSVYSGGKGATATVHGTTTMNIEGTTNIGDHVFGGGNAAETGSSEQNNSSSIVNIAGATIGKNVYGGANTSVVYGTTEVNIGNIASLQNAKITIGGTVFGGGEANASGSETYDFSFISVTKGIDINIDNTTTNDISIGGSIFGSGNASSTTGVSRIFINNYGTASSHKRNTSIQRANLVVLDNSYLELFGATDRTNEYSNVLFSLSRIKELKLSNNSTIYLETGTNLVEKFTSVVDTTNNVKAAVTIDNGTVSKNVNNRLYAKEGVNINIATNEAVTSYGVVSGMTFFGMYMRSGDGNTVEAFYNRSYNQGDTVAPGEFYAFSSGSYVLGSHVLNHDITVDGFYSNYQNEESEGIVEVKYIEPTPEASNYYMWVIGEAVSSYDVNLIASRFSTLGTYELPLINSPDPNTVFSVIGVNYAGLPGGFQLIDRNDIPRISADGTADSVMGLTMKSSRTGWITFGETQFLTSQPLPQGTLDYQSENSTTVPSLLFNLYHSKNLETAGNIGTVVVHLMAIKPIDDLNNEVTRVNININLSRALYSSNEYEGAMTSGEVHEVFVSTKTDITDNSKLSTYYSLFIDNTDNIYKTGYHRNLVSSFALPENTKITMMDFTTATPTYYYYVVNAADYAASLTEFAQHNEASYPLSRFIKMGSTSTNNNYDDVYQNSVYYKSDLRIVSEEFVFIVDYGESEITENKLDQTLLIELRNNENQTIIGVLGIHYSNLTYNIYDEADALIEITAALSKNNIYIKEATNLNVTTNFIQPTVNGVTIHDTTYYDKKLGIKLTMYDSNNNQLNGASLLGVTFTVGGITYYPRMDGTTRINIAPTIANVSSKIVLDTLNSNLQSGTYKIKVESFGSADGIYYGLLSSDTKEVTLNILNNIYGLKSTLTDRQMTIDSTTGKTMNDSNVMIFNIDYASGLASPNLRLSLKRRMYDQVHSLNYQAVDISNYITHSYAPIGTAGKYEYLLSNTLFDKQTYYLYLKENLVTGTYRVTFSLYDGSNFIGEVYNYIVIR